MATAQEAISRLQIQVTEDGADQATASLNKLAEAQGGVAVASAQTEKSSLSLEGSFARLERRFNTLSAQQQQYEKIQRLVNDAVAQNPTLSDRANAILEVASAKYAVLNRAANDNTDALSFNRAQLLELGHVAKATFEQIATGTPALQVLAQQGASTAQALSNGPGGVAGSLATIGRTVVGFLGPLGTAAAAFLVLEGAAIAYFGVLKKDGPTTEEIFKEQDRLLKVIKDSYDRVTDSTRKWFEQSKNVTQLQLLEQQIVLQQKLREEVGKTIQSTTQPVTPLGSEIFGALFHSKGAIEVKSQFGAFEDAIIHLQETYKAGQPDIKAFNDEVARIALADPALKKTAADLIVSVGTATKFANSLEQVNAALKLISGGKLSGDQRNALGLPDVKPEQVNAYQQLIDRTRDRIAQLELEAKTAGQTSDAVLKLKLQQEAEAAAKKAHVPINQAELDIMKEKLAAADRLKTVNDINANIEFQGKTALLSPEDLKIAQELRPIFKNDIPAALNSSQAAAIRFNDTLKNIGDSARQYAAQFATDFVGALRSGKSTMEALGDAATNLSNTLTSAAFKDLFQGNFVQAGIEGVGAIITGIFGANEKEQEELQKAKDAWAKMTDQLMSFNEAAKGIDLGPLTQELRSLISEMGDLRDAALKAGDTASARRIEQNFISGIDRIIGEFAKGTQTLTPYQQAVKAVNDEAQGLIDTLKGQGYGSLAQEVVYAQNDQLRQLVEQFTTSTIDSLQQRINAANGKDYVNSATSLLAQHQQDIAQAQQLGISMSLVNNAFAAEAQKIVDDAGLVGDSFNDFIKQFPEFAGVVTQSASALQEANDKFAQLTQTISDYLNSLSIGANSILSPQDQLALAQSNFQKQLSLASGGDQTALGSITQFAQTYIDQAKGFYASSSGYADIYNAVTSALQSLIGAGGASSLSSPISSPLAPTPSSLAGTSVPGVTMPQISVASDSGNQAQLFGQQTTALSQVFTQVGYAQVTAIQNGVADLGRRLDKVVDAIERGGRKPARPAGK